MADCSVPFSRPPPPIVAAFSLKNITVRAVDDGTDDVRCVYPRLAHSVTTGVRPIPDTLDIRRSSRNSNSFQPKSPQRRSKVPGNNPSKYTSLLERYRCPTTIPGSPGWGMYHCRHMPTYPGPVINGDKVIALVNSSLEATRGLRPGFQRVYLMVCGFDVSGASNLLRHPPRGLSYVPYMNFLFPVIQPFTGHPLSPAEWEYTNESSISTLFQATGLIHPTSCLAALRRNSGNGRTPNAKVPLFNP